MRNNIIAQDDENVSSSYFFFLRGFPFLFASYSRGSVCTCWSSFSIMYYYYLIACIRVWLFFFFSCFLYVFLNLLLRLPLCLLGLLGLWRTTQLPSQLSLLLGGFYVYEKKDQKDGVPFRRSTGFIPDTLNSTNSNNITFSRCIYHEKDSGSNQI